MIFGRLGFLGGTDIKEASWQVLRHEQFRRFFAGSLVSNFGTWVQNTAQILLAYQLRHSVFTVGLVTCVQFSSPLLLGSWASWLADRFGSRRTLIATQLVSGGITGTLAILDFTHTLHLRLLLAGVFMTGLMFTFALPAQVVIISALVPSDRDAKAALVMNSVSYNAGRTVAPVFGVVMVMTVGFGWAFMLNAVSFGIFVVVLLTVRLYRPLPPVNRSRVRDGFRVAWDNPKILLLLLMVAMVTFADDPVAVLGPALARHAGIPEDYSGYFLSALGVGSVLGSLLPRRTSPSARRSAAALAVLGICMMTFVLVPIIWMSIVAAFAAGLAGLITGSETQAMLMALAGPQRAMRVMGLWAIAWAGSKPVASMIDGTLPSIVGVRITGVLLALPTLLPLVILLFFPSMMRWMTRRPSAEGAVLLVQS